MLANIRHFISVAAAEALPSRLTPPGRELLVGSVLVASGFQYNQSFRLIAEEAAIKRPGMLKIAHTTIPTLKLSGELCKETIRFYLPESKQSQKSLYFSREIITMVPKTIVAKKENV